MSLVLRPPAEGDRGVILNCLRPDDGERDPLSSVGDPSDCGAGGLTEIVAPYCIDSADISSTTIRSRVLEATASCNTREFLQTGPVPPDVDYLTEFGRDDQAPWENTTVQGPAGRPVTITIEGFNTITQSEAS